jgi:hypothetical protein
MKVVLVTFICVGIYSCTGMKITMGTPDKWIDKELGVVCYKWDHAPSCVRIDK